MGFKVVHQLLKLGRGEKLDNLIEQLRPMPGHRVRLLNFIEEERTRAQCASSSTVHGARFADAGAVTPSEQAAIDLLAPASMASPSSLRGLAAAAAALTAPIPVRGGSAGRTREPQPRKSALKQQGKRPDYAGQRVVVEAPAAQAQLPTAAPTTSAAAVAAAVAAANTAAAAASGLRRPAPPVPPVQNPADDPDEAVAMNFLRASWAREMLTEAVGTGASTTGREEACESHAAKLDADAAEMRAFARAEVLARAEARAGATSLGATETYENDFEPDEEDGEGAAGDAEEKENAPSATVPPPAMGDDMAAVRHAMKQQLSGAAPAPLPPLGELALPPLCEVAEPEVMARRPSVERASTVHGPSMAVDERSESALKAGRVQFERRSSPPASAKAASPSTSEGGRRQRSLLANSLDTFAPPRGVVWQPDRKEVYTSVAFVLQKHIELAGRFLLVRTDPSPNATMSALPEAAILEAQRSPDSVVPPAAVSGGRSAVDRYGGAQLDEDGEEEEPEAMSPDLPAGVRKSFLAGARSMHGLRYSLELSPVVEVRERASRLAPAPAGAAKGGSSHGLPVGGKFGVPLEGQGEMWEDAEWADEEEEGCDLDDTAMWEDGWTPASEDFSIFDELLHPLREGSHPEPPTFASVSNYIRAIAQSARMGAEASVVALAYIERLISSTSFPLNERTWRKCALTAFLLAHKMWDDECLENPNFAAIFGYDVDDINALEQKFCSALGFRLSLSSAEYARYYFALRSICQASTEAFPLRPLDAELEAKLARSAASVAGCALGSWAYNFEQADLSRSA